MANESLKAFLSRAIGMTPRDPQPLLTRLSQALAAEEERVLGMTGNDAPDGGFIGEFVRDGTAAVFVLRRAWVQSLAPSADLNIVVESWTRAGISIPPPYRHRIEGEVIAVSPSMMARTLFA